MEKTKAQVCWLILVGDDFFVLVFDTFPTPPTSCHRNCSEPSYPRHTVIPYEQVFEPLNIFLGMLVGLPNTDSHQV